MSSNKISEVISALKRNNINGHYAADKEEALKLALSLIPHGSVVGLGNSLTIREIDLLEALQSDDYKLINQFEQGISPEENLKRRKNSMLSDVYVTGTNALTMEGELVNIDGKGNRVAAMLFGPDKVVVVVGKNKIVASEEAAWERLKVEVAPSLAKRLGRNTPCVATGKCSDCNSPQRICRCYTVIRSQMPADALRIHVIIVGEDLGI